MLNAPPPPLTVNCVVKLNPDPMPSRPTSVADHSPLAAVCVAVVLAPQPLSMTATSSSIATSFMTFPSAWITCRALTPDFSCKTTEMQPDRSMDAQGVVALTGIQFRLSSGAEQQVRNPNLASESKDPSPSQTV